MHKPSLLASLLAIASPALAQDVQPRIGAPVPGLTAAELARFEAGRQVFDHAFGPAEGRGPNFNDTACNGCHNFPADGGSATTSVTRFGKLTGMVFDPLDSLGGSLLQSSTNTPGLCDEFVPPEANVTTQRTTPPVFGFGLIDAIPDADIIFWANNPAPGITGKVHMVELLESPGNMKVGRFGWKNQVATVLSFSGDAFNNEMGMTNRMLPNEQAPNGDLAKLALCDTVADPEDGPDAFGFEGVDRMTDFQRFLAAPPQTPKSGMTGEAIFNSIGCADCHVSSAYTTSVVAEGALSGQAIKPYSDFLLHNMGSLGDNIVQGAAGLDEFRTSPLWGLYPRTLLSLLHDGRASGGSPEANIASAINFHDGEGAASRNAYLALSATDQQHLANFLLSLGQVEFDNERDNDIDEFDWFFIEPTVTGPAPVAAISPDSFDAISDIDQDGDFDLRDIAAFQRGFTGQ